MQSNMELCGSQELVRVESGQTQTVNLQLETGAVVTGRAVDADGAPGRRSGGFRVD